MHTIKQASARSGVSIPTIRVWERRYGVVSPTRTAAGYRLYDDESIARLRAMRHLVEHEGWRPSQAAERVVAGASDPEWLASLAGDPSSGGEADPGRASVPAVAIDALVDAARRLDVAAMDLALDEAFAAQRFEAVMDRVVFPALRAVGAAWAAGEIDVAREHAASEAIRRRVGRFFDAAAVRDDGRRVLIGLPPGSYHELGAFAFAVAARRAGLSVVYLGADVPLESWPRTVRSFDPEAIVIAVATPTDVDSARTVIDVLRSAADPPVIAVGGPAGAALTHVASIRLPDSIEGGVEALVARLVGPGNPVERAAP